MNDFDSKQEFYRALGLRKLTDQEKLIRLSASTSNNQSKSDHKTRVRPVRRVKPTGGIKSPLFSDWKLAKKPKPNRNMSVKPVKKKPEDPITPPIIPPVLPSSPPLQANKNSVILLPKQTSPQQSVQVQPNIVIGQTIFQAPNGKKFILIPSSASQKSGKGIVTLAKKHAQTHAQILPLPGNVKIQSSKSVNPPQRFIYLPRGQTVVGAANVGSSGLMRSVTIPHVDPSSVATVVSSGNVVPNITTVVPRDGVIISPPHNAELDEKSARQNGTATTTLQPSTSPNIAHLLNMTKNVLKETETTSVSVSSAISQLPATPASLTSFSIQSSTGNVIPSSPLIPTVPLSVSALQQASSRPLQVMRIKGPELMALQGKPSFSSTTLAHQGMYITNSVCSSSSSQVPSVGPVSVVPNCTSVQAFNGAPKIGASTNHIGILSIVESPITDNSSTITAVTPVSVSTTTALVRAQSVVSSLYKAGESSLNHVAATLDNSFDNRDDLKNGKNEHGEMKHSSVEAQLDGKRPVKYVCDPDRNLRNPETNCVVILRKKRKKLGHKACDAKPHRRYGGPPFTPCKAPPTPNTPSSATGCLYEHTLLKMATRGFWGCEMGKLQDVFRSIRCESIDQDTVEDVTKRCYGFVRGRLLQASDDSKSMYRYMKNYIDEFDNFLNRVYPVAIIAMLVYLPTAADYSLVSWHGIPPTGWSEYRRAVVMREVFEVIYRFGNELGTVPEYEKEFFDSPIRSPLLVPRVFDLRQSYSDPTTCFVQRLSHGDKSNATMNKTGGTFSNEDNVKNDSCVTEKDGLDGGTRSEAVQNLRCANHRLLSATEGADINGKTDLIEDELLGPIKTEDSLDKDSEMQKWCFGNGDSSKSTHDQGPDLLDDNLMTVMPRKVECMMDGRHDAQLTDNVMQNMIRIDSGCGFGADEPGVSRCEGNQELQPNWANGDVTDKDLSQKLYSDPIYHIQGESPHGLNVDKQPSQELNVSPTEDHTLGSISTNEGEQDTVPKKGRKIISAKFAESIAAACSNNVSWNERSLSEGKIAETSGHVVNQRAGSTSLLTATIATTTTSTTSTAAATERTVSEMTAMSEAITAAATGEYDMVTAVENADLNTMVTAADIDVMETTSSYASMHGKHENTVRTDPSVTESRRNSSDIEMGMSGELSRRRPQRRVASSTRYDLLVAADDVSLERDLRKAIKLSKLEKTAARKSSDAKDDDGDTMNNKSNELKKAERLPLKISIKQLKTDSESDDETPGNALRKLKKLKRSVAFEALWTQKSVEEPLVLLDGMKYSLGEFLERFPIEMHCPPERTIIQICNEDYNARDVLGYLRRGTQLVEQIGNEVVIDTTTTVKANSTILAVRKVPPGKISKLVHPDLHLENYTSYLLPLGAKQPLKAKKGMGRSCKVKRKPSTSKEDLVVKSEPQSPVLISSPSQMNSLDDASMSPPPMKVARLENEVCDKDENTMDVEPEIDNVRSVAIACCKETQTIDQDIDTSFDFGAMRNIKDVESLETALSTVLETALAGLVQSNMATNGRTNGDAVDKLIESYERAGNFLLNTAKMLGKFKPRTLDNNAD